MIMIVTRDKKIVDILREEITNVIRSKDGSSSWKLGDSVPDLTCEDLNAMFRTESSIMEALRMRSSSLSIRRVKENMSLKLSSGIFAVCKVDTIVIASQALHQVIEIHSNPANFLWIRFLEESLITLNNSFNDQKIEKRSNLIKLPTHSVTYYKHKINQLERELKLLRMRSTSLPKSGRQVF